MDDYFHANVVGRERETTNDPLQNPKKNIRFVVSAASLVCPNRSLVLLGILLNHAIKSCFARLKGFVDVKYFLTKINISIPTIRFMDLLVVLTLDHNAISFA